MNKLIKYSLPLFLLLLIHFQMIAQLPQDTLKVLFVGNSYSFYNNLPQVVSLISDSTKTKLVTRKSAVGGVNLKAHWHGEEGLRTREIIQHGHFDIVILQDHSMGTITAPDTFLKYSKLLCDLVKKQGATPAFYVTWARENSPHYQQIINEKYAEAAAQNDALLIPVGNAWQLARLLRPEIQLYEPDGSHPNELGSFLAACVFVAKLSGELPAEVQDTYNTLDIFGESIRLMKLEPRDVVFCKKVAKTVVLE